jgi:hypothetical protein
MSRRRSGGRAAFGAVGMLGIASCLVAPTDAQDESSVAEEQALTRRPPVGGLGVTKAPFPPPPAPDWAASTAGPAWTWYATRFCNLGVRQAC